MTVKLTVFVALAAACGGSDTDCKSAVEGAAKRFGRSGVSEVATLIGECTQRGWTGTVRHCFANAKDGQALEDCLPPLDIKVPPPVVKPSQTTIDAAAKAKDVRVLLFYAPSADVLPVLDAYFKALGTFNVEHHDRLVEPDNAKRYGVSRDRVVLVNGDRHVEIDIDAELSRAAYVKLPHFDQDVASAIADLSRKMRRAYLTTGHGEINDPATLPPALAGKVPERRTAMLRSQLAARDSLDTLASATLATDVPADANLVVVAAPATELSKDEYAALGRYLDRGGALLLALDPTAPPGLGPLEVRLGVTFDHGHLVDDKSFLPTKHEAADHRLVLTNMFTAHPSTVLAARGTNPVVLIDSGTLAAAPSSTPASHVKVTFTVKSMSSAFVDGNGNFELDPGERRQAMNVAAAITDGDARVIVLADADLLSDVFLAGPSGGGHVSFSSPAFVEGALTWLAGEETFVSEAGLRFDEIETKAGLVAERELVDRRRLRALARAIAATSDPARENAASEARQLERDLSRLRDKIDKAHD